ncbi:XRE family transcriptional regulator [Pelistega indica]|uniref:XRE family transcriptional regulator n=1 Tax=Pelistega indica TaxID=1414851 RepID=V8FUN2_9BURK|nr:helix-turn-helix transcriptional regulator [Pelistega indica]ETD67132.1 XRE family transcriptional regulator [Pelistega indica]
MDNIISNFNLLDNRDTQNNLVAYLRQKRKEMKLSREALALRSGVPAPTIKRFEATSEISLRQFLQLWLVLDDIQRLNILCQQTKEKIIAPKSIEEVLNDKF